MDGYEQQTGGSVYAENIRMRWLEIMDLSVQFRIGLMITDEDGKVQGCDPEIAREYIARMSRMWLELCPKVENRPEFATPWREDADETDKTKFKNLKKDFLSYRQYSANPALFFNKDVEEVETGSFDENTLFLLEEILRKVLERLEITGF